MTSVTPEPVRLCTDDGVDLDGWVHPAVGDARAVVVLVHGFTGRGDAPIVRDHARALAADGFDVLTYDARGHGRSSGRCTLGAEERHDVAAAVQRARRRHERVIVVAESAGATAALGHADEGGPVAGLVTVGAPASWRMKPTLRALGAAVLTRTPLGVAAARRWLRVELDPRMRLPDAPTAMASRLEVPLAVVHGRADPFIPAGEGEQLHAAAGGPARLDLVAGMGHGYRRESVTAVRAAVDWVVVTAGAVSPSAPTTTRGR